MNKLEEEFAAAIKSAHQIELSWIDSTIRSARSLIVDEHIESTIVDRRYALTLYARGFHDEAMEAARAMLKSANGLHNALENARPLSLARRVIEGGRKGAAQVNPERAENAKKPAIEAAIRAYKGKPRSMAGIVAKKFDVTPRYVREIKAELALP